MDQKPPPTPRNDFQAMHSPLSQITRREPVTVTLGTPLREALAIMDRMRIGSIIVVDLQGQIPLGIFTLRDLLHRVTLPQVDLDEPIASVMTGGVITVKPHTTAYEASLIMARRGLRHLLVVDEAAHLVSIVSQNDLFALQRTSLKDVSSEIRQAHDLPSLQTCARDIQRIAMTLLTQGMAAGQLTEFVSTLNDLLTLRVIELTHDEFDLPQIKWCWVALGSEGRYEQTLCTDQDNGIIFECENEVATETLRQRLLPFAQAVNQKLDACGFPLCRGGIMAGNPQWCLSLSEWRAKFADWIGNPQPKALLNAAIFFDFRPLYGDDSLSEALRSWLLDETRSAQLFLRLMAENALQCTPPLGLIRDFVFDGNKAFPNTIDLKMYGSRPFVDAARLLSLTHGVRQTSTAQRLLGASRSVNFGGDDVAAMVDSFYYIQLLRLRHQHQVLGEQGGGNRINPDRLNELDRHILKEAFKQARKLQNRLKLDYQL
jgi:CBS domain-containing protein